MKKEVIEIEYRKDKLYGILYLPELDTEPFPVIIHINGLPGFSPEEEENRFVKTFTKLGLAYFAFEHRGARKSTGIFDYYGAQEAIDYVINQLVHHPLIDPSRIVLFGESFGGAMAICHAARDERIKTLLLRSPVFDTEYVASMPIFDGLAQIWKRNGDVRFPASSDLKKLFQHQSFQYNPKKLISYVNIPFCIVTGDNDPIIPHDKAKEIYEMKEGVPKIFTVVSGADHNFSEKEHLETAAELFSEFLKEHLGLE